MAHEWAFDGADGVAQPLVLTSRVISHLRAITLLSVLWLFPSLLLAATPVLTGRVADSRGKPITGASVSVQTEDGRTKALVTTMRRASREISGGFIWRSGTMAIEACARRQFRCPAAPTIFIKSTTIRLPPAIPA